MGSVPGLISAGSLAAVLFVIVFGLDGWTRPGYRLRYHTVSALALGDRGWLQTVNFLVNGAVIAVGGAAMVLGGTDAGLWWPLGACLVAVGLALVASGAFPMDPMRGYPPGTHQSTPRKVSSTHTWHDRAGAVVFAGLPLTAVVAALTAPMGWGLRIASVVAALITGFLASKFAAAWEADGPATGLWQRATLVVGLGWVAALGAVAAVSLT